MWTPCNCACDCEVVLDVHDDSELVCYSCFKGNHYYRETTREYRRPQCLPGCDDNRHVSDCPNSYLNIGSSVE